jgi:hypothetical protein
MCWAIGMLCLEERQAGTSQAHVYMTSLTPDWLRHTGQSGAPVLPAGLTGVGYCEHPVGCALEPGAASR